MKDIDLITKALAAGQQAIVALKARYRDGGSSAQAQRMHLAVYAGMEALQRLAAQLPEEEQPAGFEFGTGLPHRDRDKAPHYIPLEGWDTPENCAAARTPAPSPPPPPGDPEW